MQTWTLNVYEHDWFHNQMWWIAPGCLVVGITSLTTFETVFLKFVFSRRIVGFYFGYRVGCVSHRAKCYFESIPHMKAVCCRISADGKPRNNIFVTVTETPCKVKEHEVSTALFWPLVAPSLSMQDAILIVAHSSDNQFEIML